MNLDCARCGAHLEVSDDERRLSCPYCGATRYLGRTSGTNRRTFVVVAALGVLVLGALAFGAMSLFVPGRRPETPSSPALPAPAARLAEPAPPPPEPPPAPPSTPLPPTVLPGAGEPRPAPPSPRPPSRNRAREAPPAPVMTKAEARGVLEPELRACLGQHRVHRLVVRIGQGYRPPPGLYPPLTLVHEVFVDGHPVPEFERTPLGGCVLEAAGRVWTDARKGAYLHFDVKNAAVPDPLAGQPDDLDRARAEAALTDRDEAARECRRRQLEGVRPGRGVAVNVHFRGADGRVTKVEPIYVEAGSPYARCLREAYAGATVPRFRRLEQRLVHRLDP